MTTPMTYPLPKVRITINFGERSDGGPESVEVEVDKDLDPSAIGELVTETVTAAQKRRDPVPAFAWDQGVTTTSAASHPDTWITTTNSAEAAQ